MTRYGGVLQGASTGRRARRRARLRRPLLREERHPQNQARRVQAELHADAQRPGLDRPDGEPMSPAQDSATSPTPAVTTANTAAPVIENIDPEQIGRVIAQVPDVLGETPSSWAMPCVPAAGIQSGCLHRAAHRLAGVGRVRAGRSRLSDLDRRLLGPGRRRAGLRHRPARRSARTEHRAPDHRPEHDDGQRRAALRRSPAASSSRAPAAR